MPIIGAFRKSYEESAPFFRVRSKLHECPRFGRRGIPLCRDGRKRLIICTESVVRLLLVIKIAVAGIDAEPVYQVALTVKNLRLPIIALDRKFAGLEVGLFLQVVVEEVDDLPGARRLAAPWRAAHAEIHGT